MEGGTVIQVFSKVMFLRSSKCCAGSCETFPCQSDYLIGEMASIIFKKGKLGP